MIGNFAKTAVRFQFLNRKYLTISENNMAQIGDKNILDRKFLEFWGHLLLNVAKGQEQIENISSLMNIDSITNMDFLNFKELSKVFRQSYGLSLDDSTKDATERQNAAKDDSERAKLRESLEAFQLSFAKYATLWGWIPKKTHDKLKQNYQNLEQDHADLQNEYNTLKQKADMQEELISQLRNLLNAKGMGHIELFDHLQNLTRKQTGEFQNLLQNLQTLFKLGDNKKK